jgi:hypothetical protein
MSVPLPAVLVAIVKAEVHPAFEIIKSSAYFCTEFKQ